jgi:predicted PurR-regulated permease PerM
MSKPRRLAWILVTLAVSSLILPRIGASTGPSPAAFQAFSAIRAAEDSGADISSLISQYNILLQQNATESSYNSLGQLASNAQVSAMAQRNLDNTITLVAVPVITLLLTLSTVIVLRFRNRLEEDRILEMEVGET